MENIMHWMGKLMQYLSAGGRVTDKEGNIWALRSDFDHMPVPCIVMNAGQDNETLINPDVTVNSFARIAANLTQEEKAQIAFGLGLKNVRNSNPRDVVQSHEEPSESF